MNKSVHLFRSEVGERKNRNRSENWHAAIMETLQGAYRRIKKTSEILDPGDLYI